MSGNTEERLAEAKKEAENLRAIVKQNIEAVGDTNLLKSSADVPAIAANLNLKLRRTLKGHLGKIYAMQWAEDKDTPTLASASQDGKMLVWNAVNCLKMHAIPLPSNWVMTCAYSSKGEYVASGGLDNACSIWNLRGQTPTKVLRELQGHGGFLSCCRFLDDKEILTSSGDHTCGLWNIETAVRTTEFKKHEGDVMYVSLTPERNSFCSGSCDKAAIVWDTRSGKATHTFLGHERDVNVVQYFPNNNAIMSGSEDGTCRLWDLRSYNELSQYKLDNAQGQPAYPTSLCLSVSGRFMFTAYSDMPIQVWDVLKGERKGNISASEKRVTSLGLSGDGSALCSASWDALLKIWTSAA